MNRIVRERYPVSKLPEELRDDFGSAAEVRLTIEAMEALPLPSGQPVPRPGLFSRYRPHAKVRFTSGEEIDDHIRALREEWDHRDR